MIEQKPKSDETTISSWFQRFKDYSTQSDHPTFIEKLHACEWEDHEMILSVNELAGAAHIPNKEIETPKIDWCYAQRGGEVPADSQREE